MTGLYRRLLGPAFDALPAPVRAFHDRPGRWSGRADIRHGPGARAALMRRTGGFPPAGADVLVTVQVQWTGTAEVWDRRFGGHRTRSTLTPDPHGGVRERFGPVTCRMSLEPNPAGLSVGISAVLLLGRLPLPRWATPVSRATEYADPEGRYAFDIGAFAQDGGLIIRYCGWLLPDDAP